MKSKNSPAILQCHRCRQMFKATTNEFGANEHLSMRFRAGIDSVFKEYAFFECNLCPRCVNKLLGKYFTIHTTVIYELLKRLIKNPDPDSEC